MKLCGVRMRNAILGNDLRAYVGWVLLDTIGWYVDWHSANTQPILHWQLANTMLIWSALVTDFYLLYSNIKQSSLALWEGLSAVLVCFWLFILATFICLKHCFFQLCLVRPQVALHMYSKWRQFELHPGSINIWVLTREILLSCFLWVRRRLTIHRYHR